ncbi:MAG TPA: hypothetical protein DEB10_00665 [Ruminococcaceae bacterium]|jgi:hypothetical protein|nr:hypothetical protein [Oscillospiraceae bacterium]HCA30670.1 hypothetical protein [Oscillospiraceae bacterium]
MENLYIETLDGNALIPQDLVIKYHLEKGMFSPFTASKLVGENNDFPLRAEEYKNSRKESTMLSEHEEETENVMLSTSEIIDFAQGLDSHVDE